MSFTTIKAKSAHPIKGTGYLEINVIIYMTRRIGQPRLNSQRQAI